MNSPFPQSLRPCVAVPPTLGSDLRRTDKQAIAFNQHLGDEAALIPGGLFETIDRMDLAISLNRPVRRNSEVVQ